MTFVSIGQAYILNENLKIPVSKQGTISGNLVFWTEIVTLLLFVPIGALMDRIGRKQVFAGGFLLLALSYGLYPTASSVAELTLYRMIYALGIVAITGALSTILVDYPAERSRGKLIAITGFLNGLGIVVLNQFFGALPQRLTANGMSGTDAGLYTHLSIAGVALFSAVLVTFGLKKRHPGA